MFVFIGIVFTIITIGLALAVYFSSEKHIVYSDLKDKHVVVTGGSSGIGKAAAEEAARLGANVTIIGRDVAKLKSAVDEIIAKCSSKEQKIQFTSLDVTSDYNVISTSLENLEATAGPTFMLVNCAGMCICGQFEQMAVEDMKLMIDLNYFGTAYPTKYVLPGMKKRGEGVIVFVSSEAALLGIYGYSAYSGGKWAVRGLAETLFMELIGTGVRLTLAMPPDTDTPGMKKEDLTKPPETKLISGSGGLQSPDVVGKQIIHDALIGKKYSVFGCTGTLLSLLCCGSIESMIQVVVQIWFMGAMRAIIVASLLSFNKIIQNRLKIKNDNKNK